MLSRQAGVRHYGMAHTEHNADRVGMIRPRVGLRGTVLRPIWGRVPVLLERGGSSPCGRSPLSTAKDALPRGTWRSDHC